jgi:8-oxo-dGTP pyrophosphatase MutT (NUDIX family)
MDKYTEIRPIVIGIAKKDNKILVAEGFDEKKNEFFYRALGGGIEFGEKSYDALKREFLEELGIEIEIDKYLGIAENIFEFNGRKAHELVLMYDVIIKEEDYKDNYIVNDDKGQFKGMWIDIEECIRGEKILYPKEVFDYIK